MTSTYLGTDDVDLVLTERNFTKGRLQNGKNLLILFDSGASKSIISQQYVNSSPYLSQIKTTKVTPVQFRLGNGQFLISDKAIKFKCFIQGHKFEIAALIVNNLVGVDLILGTNTLSDLDGTLNFKNNRFRIKSKTISFAPPTKVTIQPGDSRLVTVQGRIPPHLRNSDVVLTANNYLARHCPTTMIVTLHKGRTQLLVTNSSDKPLTFSKGRPIAFLDTTKLVNVTQELPMDSINMTLNFTDNLHHTEQNSLHTDNAIRHENLRKYPHLDPDDPIVDMTEEQIIRDYIDLKGSVLSPAEREEIIDILRHNRSAFSLYGELSSCPDFEVNIELTNDEPFFIRPYFATEPDKRRIEHELTKLVKLGILEVGHQPYTSPVLLLSKKNTTDKRVVTDFRYLNSRISRINHPFPLLSETLKRIGHAHTKVMSVIDLKSAFHCIPLSKSAQKYTGIASYHGGKHYYYKRLAQGLNVSPGIFQAKIDDILGTIPNSRNFCIAHHDDIILFSPDKASHKHSLTKVLKALSDNGLKVSPKKCKLFRDDVEYMGHRITINKAGEPCFQPMNNRCASIRQIPRPKTPKQVRRLVGAVNYVAGFFPNIQTILKPLHQLTRKKNKFVWTDEHETAFQKVKDLMTNPPVLHMPQSTGRFSLYSDTSRLATGSYLTQIINGKEQIIGYYSKVLPDACKRYSVTELELFGLLINISAFKHLLKGCEFDAYVDHSSIVQILKSKEEPCTTRLQKLIFKLSEYAFKIGYKKGTELVLADFLSRAPYKKIPVVLCGTCVVLCGTCVVPLLYK